MSYVPVVTNDASVNGTHYCTTALGGDRIIAIGSDGNLKHASWDSLQDSSQILGMSVGAVNAGHPLNVQRNGLKEDSSWAWNVGMPIYLGQNGIITQTIPTYPSAVFSLIVAFPITETKIFINIKEPILLGQ